MKKAAIDEVHESIVTSDDARWFPYN
jgi:hypothetical protein